MSVNADIIEMVRGARRATRRRIIKRITHVPKTAKELWTAIEATNSHFFKIRISMLEHAGWDVAGWSVMEWKRFPTKLKQDLENIFPEYQAILQEEATGLMKELRALKLVSWVGEPVGQTVARHTESHGGHAQAT